MARCVIVAGGDCGPIGPLKKDDFVIACDRGCQYCQDEGVAPDLLLGDFDSWAGELPAGVPVLRYPVEKDDTDTMLAIRWAIEHGYDELRLCCALGGTDRYSVPYIVYETPTAYVLIVPNDPSVYALQAIAWNIDFTQFR